MRVGDTVMAKTFKRWGKSAIVESEVTFRAPKGEAFVFIVLGTTSVKDPKFNPDDVLEAMGWRFMGDNDSPVTRKP